jgi:hypothetical protein
VHDAVGRQRKGDVLVHDARRASRAPDDGDVLVLPSLHAGIGHALRHSQRQHKNVTFGPHVLKAGLPGTRTSPFVAAQQAHGIGMARLKSKRLCQPACLAASFRTEGRLASLK